MNAVPSYTNAAGWARTPRCHKRNKGGRARGLRHPRQAGEGRVESVRGRAAPKGKQTSRPTAVGRAGPQLRRPRTREGRRRPGTKGRGAKGCGAGAAAVGPGTAPGRDAHGDREAAFPTAFRGRHEAVISGPRSPRSRMPPGGRDPQPAGVCRPHFASPARQAGFFCCGRRPRFRGARPAARGVRGPLTLSGGGNCS